MQIVRSAGRRDRRPERDEDGDRKRSSDADRRQQQRQRQPAPTIGLDVRQAEDAAAHQDEEHGEHDRPREHQPLAPQRPCATCHQHRDHQKRRRQRTPLLGVRIATEEDQPVLLGDHTPTRAGAVERATRGDVGSRDRVDDRPFDERRNVVQQRSDDGQRRERAARAAEQLRRTQPRAP